MGKLDNTDFDEPDLEDPFPLNRVSLVQKVKLELKGRDLATFRQAPVEKAVYTERSDPDVQVEKLALSERRLRCECLLNTRCSYHLLCACIQGSRGGRGRAHASDVVRRRHQESEEDQKKTQFEASVEKAVLSFASRRD